MNRKIIGNDLFGVEIKSTLMFFLDEVNADVGPLAGALQELYNGHSGGFATRLALASVFPSVIFQEGLMEVEPNI